MYNESLVQQENVCCKLSAGFVVRLRLYLQLLKGGLLKESCN